MFWRTLVLSVLWVYVHCQFEIKIKEKDTLYQVSLNESQSSIELQVNKDTMQSARHGYLIINPTSDHSFEVRSGMKGEEKLRCIGTHTTICIMSMDEEENHVKSIKGYNILVNMNCGNSCNGTLGISISDHIHSSHLGSTNIMMADVSELKLDLSFKLSEKTNKLRFHAGGYSKKHDLHSLSLTCYGNVISDAWPSESSHEFQLNHIHGNELSHVVYSHDKFFCKKYSDCNYKITCNTFEIYRIVFYAIESEKIETLTEFETYYDILSPLASSPTTGLYKFDLDQSMLKEGAKVYVTLDNVEGNSKLYVNPAFLPEFSPNSLYAAEAHGPKQITISPDELRRALRHDATIQVESQLPKQLFIMVMAEGASSYFLKVSYQKRDDAYNLELNRPQSGLIAPGEMKDFVVEFETINEDHERKFLIELDSSSKDIFIYARKCEGELACGFFDDRVVKDKTLPDDNDIKMNENALVPKVIEMSYSCGKKNSYKSMQVSHSLTIYRCVLDIGVYSNEKNNTDHKEKSFTIKVQDKSLLHIVPTSRWTHFVVLPEQPLTLQFNIHRRQYNPYKFIQYLFDVHYGSAKAYFSKKNKNPCNESDLIGTRELLESATSLYYVERNMTKDNKLSGAYYVCIKASSPLGLTLMSHPVVDNYKLGEDDPMLNNVPMLAPNHQVLGELPAHTDQTLFFAISVNLDSDQTQSIKLHVTPIRGKFRLFVSNNGKRPSPTQNYWNTLEETLEIQPRDKVALSKGLYIIGVQLANAKNSSDPGLPNKFLISFTFGDKHIMLRRGKPFMGESTFASPHQYLHIKFPKSTTENITVYRTSLTRYTSLYFSFNHTNTNPNQTNKDAFMPPFYSVFVLKKELWSKYCNESTPDVNCTLYINVFSVGSSRYSIQYALNGGPIIIPHGFPFSIPTLNEPNEALHLIYHVDKHHPAEIEVRPLFHPVNYIIGWSKELSNIDDYRFPTSENGTGILASGDSTLRPSFSVDFANTTKDDNAEVLLLSLYQNGPTVMFGPLRLDRKVEYTYNGLLEISTDAKYLISGRPITESSLYGEWKFFKLTHPIVGPDDLTIHVEMITGVAEVYVSKGTHRLPSETYYLKKRHDITEASIFISREEVPFEQKFGGDYIVGVRCSSPTASYQVLYEQASSKYLSLDLGVPVNYRIQANIPTYLEVPSDGLQQDILITFHSRYAHLKLHASVRKMDNLTEEELLNQKLPNEESYLWFAEQEASKSGFGRLVIRSNDPNYCTMCTYVIRVTSSEDDKVDFTAVKKSAYSLTRILEGKTYIGDLKKGENDTYALVVPGNETFLNLNCKIMKGNITFIYSLDPTFSNPSRQYIIPERKKDEFFNVNFGHLSSFIRGMFDTKITRFIRIQAMEEDSQYSFTVVSDNMLTELTTIDSQQAIIGMGAQHIYYFPCTQNETVEVSFFLRSVDSTTDANFEYVVRALPSMIKFYQAKTWKEVESRSYDYELPVKFGLNDHQLQANMRPNKGYVVAVVSSKSNMAINYEIELSRLGMVRLAAGHERAYFVEPNMTKYYLIDSKEDNYDAKVHFDVCMNSIHANYTYVDQVSSNVKSNQAKSQENYVPLVNERLQKDNIPIEADKTIKVSVTKGDLTSVEMITEGGKIYPSIYKIRHEILPRTGGRDQSLGEFVVGDLKNYGEVEVFSDADQNVKFEGLQFHDDFLKANTENTLLINYTLYITKDQRMLTFVKHCGYYMIDQAIEAFGTNEVYAYSYLEFHSAALEQKRKEVPIISIKPHTTSFGGVFYGVIVAEVKLWPKNVNTIMTFPKAKTFRVYYNQFEFEPSDNSIALVFLFTFLGIATVMFLLYVMSKNKVLDKLRNIRFIDNVMSEFNEEDVGNHLVLEVIDYKKHKKARADKRAQEILDQSTTSQPESGTELKETLDESKAA